MVEENKATPSEVPKTEIIHDHPVFKKVEEGDLETIQNYFEVEGLSLEIEDQHGMTPLMHASWKGTIDVAKYLIKQGADANGGNHEHNYTCLHFAGLAGKAEICSLLLEAGAKTYHTNSVNRTASAMAAFVGNHHCVSVINNYVPKEDVVYFTRKQPFEETAKLTADLAKPLHDLVMSMNTHPVRIALKFRDNPKLLENVTMIRKVLEMMSDKEFKNRTDVNEVMSLKYHIIHYIVKDIEKQLEKDKKQDPPAKSPFIDRWIKWQLIGREEDGYPVYQENFLRQGIKEFPFPESQLFKMLVTNFSHCKNYGEGQTAAEYINGAFNGQKGFKDHENCDTCGQEGAAKKCSNCKSGDYCDQVCQKYHWFLHKKHCERLKKEFEVREEANKKIAEKNRLAEEKKKEDEERKKAEDAPKIEDVTDQENEAAKVDETKEEKKN